MSAMHVFAPKPVDVRCVVIDCPTCARQRRALFKLFEWYGADIICAGCGDAWQDGEMAKRPFYPRWRRNRIEYARRELAKVGAQA